MRASASSLTASKSSDSPRSTRPPTPRLPAVRREDDVLAPVSRRRTLLIVTDLREDDVALPVGARHDPSDHEVRELVGSYDRRQDVVARVVTERRVIEKHDLRGDEVPVGLPRLVVEGAVPQEHHVGRLRIVPTRGGHHPTQEVLDRHRAGEPVAELVVDVLDHHDLRRDVFPGVIAQELIQRRSARHPQHRRMGDHDHVRLVRRELQVGFRVEEKIGIGERSDRAGAEDHEAARRAVGQRRVVVHAETHRERPGAADRSAGHANRARHAGASDLARQLVDRRRAPLVRPQTMNSASPSG